MQTACESGADGLRRPPPPKFGRGPRARAWYPLAARPREENALLPPNTAPRRTLFRLRAAFALGALVASAAGPARAQEAPPPPAPDGPARLTYKRVFKEGKTTFDQLPLAEAPPLPPGFKALNGTAYRLQTDAVTVGPHVLEFSVASVRDRETFDNLEVLCAGWDLIDQKLFWTPCTIREGEHAPDFEARRVRASVGREAVNLTATGPNQTRRTRSASRYGKVDGRR